MKLLASDLDGTLFKNNMISREDLHALKRFREEGNKVIVSTGRTKQGVDTIFKDYYFDYDYLVLCNGGLILDNENKIIHKKSIPNKIVIDIINKFFNYKSSMIYYDDGEATKIIDNPLIDKSNIDRDFFESFANKILLNEALNGKKDCQMMSVFNVEQSIELAEEIRKLIIDEYGDYIEAFRNQCFIDIVPKECSKGNALSMILQDENLDADCLYCVGDSFNDVSMFNITKNSYTFNEAEEKVKPYANNIIDNVYEIVDEILK